MLNGRKGCHNVIFLFFIKLNNVVLETSMNLVTEALGVILVMSILI